jgi:protease-4
MKKFLIGLVTGVVLAVLTSFVLLFALVGLQGAAPAVEPDSTLVLNLQGSVPELVPMVIPLPTFESLSPLTLQEIRDLLASAAHDPKITGAVLFPGGVDAGWAKMQEIRSGLLQFKESGKPLAAYLRNASAREYYLASAADKIYLSREDFLDVKGLRVEAMYLRQTLNKLGVQVEIEHAGKYKNAGDIFTEESMTPETREVLGSILDEVFAHLVETIAESRSQSVEQVRETIDNGPFLAAQALEYGLVDGLLYEDEVFEQLRSQLGQEEMRKVSHRTYHEATDSAASAPGQTQVALVVGSGSIVAGSDGGGLGGEELIWSQDFIRLLRRIKDNEQVKGVILRIDSPGGDAIASDEILREVRLLREEKPMVISMSDTAASGGYYIAMTGDPIVAYPNTITGSIGVIYGKVNLRGFYDKIGVRKEILTRGRFSDIDSDYQPLSAAGREKLREGIDAIYDGFLERVAEGRNRAREEIAPLAEGRVWLGVQAHRNGLVDELGGLDRAVELIKEKLDIPPSDRIRLISYPEKRSFWQYLAGQSGEPLIGAQVRKLMGDVDFRVLSESGILRLMPYKLDVR